MVPSFLKNTKYYSTIRFIGGNNDIINISVESSQSSNIIVDEKNREYIVEYMNTTYKEAEFCIKGELTNKCKGEWHIDLTDKEIDKKMYPEDIKDKAKLQVIAKKNN